jgi:hypothetical protein
MPFAPRPALLCLLLLAGLLAACQRGHLPADPGLAREGFGSGVQLGGPLPDNSRSSPMEGMVINVLTADDLPTATPYNSREAVHDLLLVLPGGLGTGGGSVVGELRCYAADKGSAATLLGQPLRTLTPDAADNLCGMKGDRTVTTGETHCEYTFAGPRSMKNCQLRLMLSFDTLGCFAARLWLISTAPPHF